MAKRFYNIGNIWYFRIDANPASNSYVAHARATSTTSALFQINSTKIYVPVVSLAVNNNIKFLENLKQGFKRTIS